MSYSLSSLLWEGEYRLLSGARLPESVSEITNDTRRLSPGCLFVCQKGLHRDTHLELPAILAAAPSLVLVEESSCVSPGTDGAQSALAAFSSSGSAVIAAVPSTRRIWAFLQSRKCQDPQNGMTMIGITGTNGKTSTCHLLGAALRAAGHRVGTIGTVGCYVDGAPLPLPEAGDSRLQTMTTPDPELLYPALRAMADQGVTHTVMEVSSHALVQERVAPIHFDLALLTNLTGDHLDLHGTMENYVAAKSTLFSQADVGIFNTDDPRGAEMSRRNTCHPFSLGHDAGADYRVEQERSLGLRGNEFVLSGPDCRCLLRVNVPGTFGIANAAMAGAAAMALGVHPKDLRRGLENCGGAPGRLERVTEGTEDFTVLVDFAHTEDALRQVLASVRAQMGRDGRLILVFGCGGDRDRTKRPKMGRVAEEGATLTVVTSDNPRTENPISIIREILAGFSSPRKRKVIVDRRRAIAYAVAIAQKGDVILLAGKGHEAYEAVGGKLLPFSEKDIVRSEIKKRQTAHTDGERP